MDKIATPDLSHLSFSDYENVYEPAEDSFLLLDALECEIDLIESLRPAICLEVGSGSGVILSGLAKTLGQNVLYLCTDISPFAADATNRTALKNNVNVQVVNCNLIDPLVHRLRNKVDILIFNPPYVPTEDSEISSDSFIAKAWAGGNRGRKVMDQLFPIVPEIMSPDGIFYLLIVKENDQDDILNVMASYGWKGSVVKERKAGREYLKVLRFQKV